MKYAYGASFNCELENDAVGGGYEGDTSLDYVSNDFKQLCDFMVKDNVQCEYIVTEKHQYVGQEVLNLGGKVIACLVDVDDEEYCVAVIFDNPDVEVV